MLRLNKLKKVHVRLAQHGKKNHLPQIRNRIQRIKRFLDSVVVTPISLWNGKQFSDPQINSLRQQLRTNPGLRGKHYIFK